MPRIRTADAKVALHAELAEEVRRAAGNNRLVSKMEAKGLHPFVKRSEQALRGELGKGARVSVDGLVARAEQDAVAGWDKFNPPGCGADSVFLAKDEVAAVRKADPQLGALTDRALLRLGKLPAANLAAAVTAFFDGHDFAVGHPSIAAAMGGARVDARAGQPGRAGVPQPVLDVFDFYYRAEDQDWASVSLQKGKIAGQDVWVTYMTTDGDDKYLEVMDRDGKAVASARLGAAMQPNWDAWPGRARLASTLAHIGGVRQDAGLSERSEAIAEGQIPPNGDWPGEVRIDSGFLHHADGALTAVDLPAGLTPELRDIATAAFNLLWDEVFRHQGHSGGVEIGPKRAGTMTLGTFTRPDDGKSYLVADWRDIDDASYTFYFKPGAAAPILAIEQFNN